MRKTPISSYRTEIQQVTEFLICSHCSHSLVRLVHTTRSLKHPAAEKQSKRHSCGELSKDKMNEKGSDEVQVEYHRIE